MPIGVAQLPANRFLLAVGLAMISAASAIVAYVIVDLYSKIAIIRTEQVASWANVASGSSDSDAYVVKALNRFLLPKPTRLAHL